MNAFRRGKSVIPMGGGVFVFLKSTRVIQSNPNKSYEEAIEKPKHEITKTLGARDKRAVAAESSVHEVLQEK